MTNVAFSRYLTPNSFHKTKKVATQGNETASKVAAMNNCLAVRPRGISIPMATSFLKKPTARETTASFGKPKRPVMTGEKKPVNKSNILKYKRIFINNTPKRTIGTASRINPFIRK